MNRSIYFNEEILGHCYELSELLFGQRNLSKLVDFSLVRLLENYSGDMDIDFEYSRKLLHLNSLKGELSKINDELKLTIAILKWSKWKIDDDVRLMKEEIEKIEGLTVNDFRKLNELNYDIDVVRKSLKIGKIETLEYILEELSNQNDFVFKCKDSELIFEKKNEELLYQLLIFMKKLRLLRNRRNIVLDSIRLLKVSDRK